jgi:hypothetical protein
MPVVEFDGFSGQGDNSLHIHNAESRGPDGYHIAAAGRVEAILEAVHEIDPVVSIGRHHTGSLDSNWQQNDMEQERKHYDHDGQSHEGALGIPSHEDSLPPRRRWFCFNNLTHTIQIGQTALTSSFAIALSGHKL